MEPILDFSEVVEEAMWPYSAEDYQVNLHYLPDYDEYKMWFYLNNEERSLYRFVFFRRVLLECVVPSYMIYSMVVKAKEYFLKNCRLDIPFNITLGEN